MIADWHQDYTVSCQGLHKPVRIQCLLQTTAFLAHCLIQCFNEKSSVQKICFKWSVIPIVIAFHLFNNGSCHHQNICLNGNYLLASLPFSRSESNFITTLNLALQWDKMHRSFNCENCVFNNLLNCGRKKARNPGSWRPDLQRFHSKCTIFSMSPIKFFLEKLRTLVLLVRNFGNLKQKN